MASEWPERRLGELIRLRKGVSYQGAYLDRPGPRLLGLGTIVPGGGLSLSAARTYGGPVREWQRIAPGEMLVALTDITQDGRVLGSPALVPSAADGQYAVTHHVARVEIIDPRALDTRFLYYVLQSRQARDYLRGVATGTTVRAVSIRDAEDLPARIPPLPEQRAISDILGTLDDKIELNRRMNETLDSIARALFNSWFVDFDPVRAKSQGRDPGLPPHIADLFPESFEASELGEIPVGWAVALLADAIEVNPPRSLRRGEVAPYLDMANMPTRGHSPDVVIDRPFGSGTRFRNGDTLVACITPCLENGKTAYVDFLQDGRVGWGSTEFIVLRPRSPLPLPFAYCLARSIGFRDFAIQRMTGSSGRQRVPVESLARYLLPMPPPRVAQSFGALIGRILARVAGVRAESRTLAALRDSLLPKLIFGDLPTRSSVWGSEQ